MSTVDTEEMKNIADKISTSTHELNDNLHKLVSAAREAQSLKDTAIAYDGQTLAVPDKEVISHMSQTKTIYGYKASVKNSEGGMASSGMRSLTGAPKEIAFMNISVLTDFADADLPEVINCIDKGIEEVETSLAKREMERTSSGSNEPSSPNDPSNPNEPSDPNNPSSPNDPSNPNEASKTNVPEDGKAPDTGSGGPSGSSSGSGAAPTRPAYRKPSNTATNTTKPNTSKPNTTQPNNTTQNNTTQPNNTIVFGNNSSSNTTQPNNTTPNPSQPNNSTPTSPNNSKVPSTDTDGDNPSPSAVVPTGHGQGGTSHTGASSNPDSPTDTPIEVLGDEKAVTAEDMEDLGNSIINGVNRVVPELTKGGKVQQGSALIPGAAGLTAAAAAGLGSKVLLDRNDDGIETLSAVDDDDDDDEENSRKKEQKDDKGWLYGMGVGLAAIGGAAAKHEKDKNEDYEIADDREVQETLEDD